MTLATRTIPIASAVAACDRWHAHHPPPAGGVFAVGAFDEGRLVCVAVVSRPVARMLARDGTVAEVTRLASDRSTRGAASATLRACVAEALARGYRRLVSYTLVGEVGACYRAARWRPVYVTRAQQWTRPGRPRAAAAQPGRKVRWEAGPDASPRCARAMEALATHAGRHNLPTRAPAQPELRGVA